MELALACVLLLRKDISDDEEPLDERNNTPLSGSDEFPNELVGLKQSLIFKCSLVDLKSVTEQQMLASGMRDPVAPVNFNL